MEGLGDLFVIAMNFELVQNAIMAGGAPGWFCGMRKWVAAASAPRSSASAPTHCTDWSQVGAAARFGLTNTSTGSQLQLDLAPNPFSAEAKSIPICRNRLSGVASQDLS